MLHLTLIISHGKMFDGEITITTKRNKNKNKNKFSPNDKFLTLEEY